MSVNRKTFTPDDERSAPRRRPSAGGYARGEETRARIVAAALQVFGEDGYEGASTRRIAEVAGVKPPALQYYFDSKEGLHRACGEFILGHAGRLFAVLERVEARLAAEGASTAVDGACEVVEALWDLCSEKTADPGHLAFMARAQADGAGPALDIVKVGLVEPLHRVIAQLVAAARGKAAIDDEVRLTAVMLLGNAAIFHNSRDKVLDFLGWADFGGDRREAVRRVLRAHTRAVLAAGGPPR